MKTFKIILKWIDGSTTERLIEANNSIHAESIVMDSLSNAELQLLDTCRASHLIYQLNANYMEAPLMYKGWIVREVTTPFQGRKLGAYNYRTDVYVNPLYAKWEQLKAILDAIKD